MIVAPSDWDTAGSRDSFRAARPNRMIVMLDRAVQRGECADDIDAAFVVELLASALSTPILFFDQPISDDYCAQVVELFLTGIQRGRY